MHACSIRLEDAGLMADKYEMPALFGASKGEGASQPDKPDLAVDEPSEGMLFLTWLGENDSGDAQAEAVLSDRPTFRLTDAEGSLEAVNGVPATLAAERRAMRRRVGASLVAITILALATLLVDPQGGYFAPSEVLSCYDRAIRQAIASVVAPSDLMLDADLLAAHETYFRVLEAIGITVETVACGVAVCVGGLLFQASFRRTYAVASIAGVSVAVLIGQGIALLATGATLGISWVALLVACVVGLVPAIVLRFRFNALNLPDESAREIGVDAANLRYISDGCAIVLLVASQVAVGPVFTLAVTIPPLGRQLFGVEFRKALVGTALLGAIALLVARLVPIPLWVSALAISALIVMLSPGTLRTVRTDTMTASCVSKARD